MNFKRSLSNSPKKPTDTVPCSRITGGKGISKVPALIKLPTWQDMTGEADSKQVKE